MNCPLFSAGIQVFQHVLLPYCTDYTMPSLSEYILELTSNSSNEFYKETQKELKARFLSIANDINISQNATKRYKKRIFQLNDLLFDLQMDNPPKEQKNESHIRSVRLRFLKTLLRKSNLFKSLEIIYNLRGTLLK